MSKKNKLCPDCGKLIWNASERCLSCARKGKNHPLFGKHLSKEVKGKIGKSHIGIRPTEQTKQKMRNNQIRGANHYNWSIHPSYNAIHKWVRKNKPKPKFCEECGLNPPYDVANISGEYIRDVNDFKWLCRSCYFKRDYNPNKQRDERGRFKCN
jgi:hypothetical protein